MFYDVVKCLRAYFFILLEGFVKFMYVAVM